MVDTRTKGSGSRSRASTRTPVDPEPVKISLEVSPDDASCGEVANSDESKRVEEVEPIIVGEGVIADDGGVECRIETNDFIAVGDHEKTEELIDGGVAKDNVTTVEADPDKDDVPMNSGFGDKGVTNDYDEGTVTSPRGKLVESVREPVETDVVPEGDEVTICSSDTGGVNVVMIEGGINDDGSGLLVPEGPLEGMIENVNNCKGVNELNAEEPMSASPGNDREKFVRENMSISNQGEAAAEKVSRPKRMIARKNVIKKKKLPGKVDEAEGKPSDGDGSNKLCKADTSAEANAQCLGSNEELDEACKGDGTEHVEKEENAEVKPVVNINTGRRRLKRKELLSQGHSPAEVASNEQNPKPTKLDPNGEQALDQAFKGVETEHVENEEKTKVKPVGNTSNRLRRLRRKELQSQGHSPVEAASNEQNPKPTEVDPNCEEDKETTQQENNAGEAESSGNKTRRFRKGGNKVVEEGDQKVNVKVGEDTRKVSVKNNEKPGSSKKDKSSKKVESMGMIFMCSSETKKDCYKYKVLGLPAAKKDVVSKIYKGMRLFLFDVNLKMLYGIYKAAGPGGYNIEPRAFKSQFPSQVKFTVMEDCLPLAEEKFKKVIIDNYYTKNKFDCQLTHEQVKNLCKLFNEFTKKASSKRDIGSQRAVASSSGVRGKKRKRGEETRGVGGATSLERERSRRRGHGEVRRSPVARVREEVQRAPLVRVHEEVRRAPAIRGHEEVRLAPVIRDHEELRLAPVIRGHEEIRHAPVIRGHEEIRRAPAVIDERYRHPAVMYDRDNYLPSIDPSAFYQPVRATDPTLTRSYTYERSPGLEDTFRRDSARDYRDLQLPISRELRHPVELRHQDPYVLYGEPRSYREQDYGTDTRLSFGGRYAEHPSSLEYRPPPPPHRRY